MQFLISLALQTGICRLNESSYIFVVMLGRRHYRVKVLQTLYAYFQGGETRLEIAEKNLFRSLDLVYELYYVQFSFLLEVIHFYRFRMEESKTKFYPTPEELNPSFKLLENRLIVKLQSNIPLSNAFSLYRVSWTEEQEIVRKVYQKLKASKEYQQYIRSTESNYQEDQGFLEVLFKKFIARSSDFQYFCEERNIFWEDDFEVAALFVLKTIRLITEEFSDSDEIKALFHKDSPEDQKEDKLFIEGLFRKTILHSEEWDRLIETRTRNWELDRIALTDILLIKMALTELTEFSQIPVKVTLNEYIELSKQFSSGKSKSFINGILDNLVADLQQTGMIKKTGRGLMT
jgi:N utilization substance protein B